MRKSFLFLLIVASLNWAQAPTGNAVSPSAEEQTLLQNVRGKLSGVIVWSTSRANSSHDLWIMNADGTEAKALTASNDVDWFPRISPDGKTVLFNRSTGGWVPETDADLPDRWNLWMIDIDGQNLRQVVTKATWGTWKNAEEIVFSRGGQVFVKNLAQDTETLLFDGEVNLKKGVIVQEPNLSPDGNYLAATLRGSMRETGIWDFAKKQWVKSGEGCQIDWFPSGDRIYRVNPTGNGGTAAPSEILAFPFKDGQQEGKVGFFGVPKEYRLMDLPGRRSHEYFPRIDNTGKWLVWGATDKGHDHDIYDYELYLWNIEQPANTAARITFHTGNDRWPDIWIQP